MRVTRDDTITVSTDEPGMRFAARFLGGVLLLGGLWVTFCSLGGAQLVGLADRIQVYSSDRALAMLVGGLVMMLAAGYLFRTAREG